MVLVGTDHPADHVAIASRVVCGDARPEASDLDEDLRAEEGQELDVVGRLVVLPDVVGDRELMCRWRWELSGFQRPERGLRWTVGVSSTPFEPLCHGYIAPSYPDSFAARRAASSRR